MIFRHFKNQKNFYQFLFYATTGDAIAALFLMIRLLGLNYSIRSYVPLGTRVTNPFQLMYYMWEPIQTFVGFACALAMTISIGTLFRKQTEMIFNNQTTIREIRELPFKPDTLHFKELEDIKRAYDVVKPTPVNYNRVQNQI